MLRNTADIQFRNEGMHRAAEVLTQVTDLSKLTRLKFLVDDIGTPCNCNMYVCILPVYDHRAATQQRSHLMLCVCWHFRQDKFVI